MPIMMIMEWSGVTSEQYDALRKVVNLEANPPPGGMFHVAAATPAGLRITDIWDRPESFQQFVETRLMPAVQQIGVTTQPKVEVFPVHAVYSQAFKPL